MKKFILSVMVLFMVSTAMAESYCYINDFDVIENQIGTNITVPVKAHFEGRVSGIQLNVTCPEGLTPVSAVGGSDMTVSYFDRNGAAVSSTASFDSRSDFSLMLGILWEMGYYDNDGDGNYEPYGVVKWEAGEYNEMILLTMRVEEGFEEGDIIVETEVAAGQDARGGTVEDLGDSYQVESKTCHARVVPVPPSFLSVADVEVLNGDTVTVPVSLTNAVEITAFQTDLYLPEGFELLGVEATDRMSDHTLTTSNRADGSVRILCYSSSLAPFAGNEGALFNLKVKVPAMSAPTEIDADATIDYTVELKNSRLTTSPDFAEVRCGSAVGTVTIWTYLPGDVNGDRKVTVTDVVLTASYILGNDPESFILPAADMNGDGEITVTDVVLIADLVLHPDHATIRRAPAMGQNDDLMIAEDIRLSAGETRTVTITLDNEMDYTAFQLNVHLPDGLIASNYRLTDRAGNHSFDANTLSDGTERVICYSPMLATISGNKGALLTFDVTATGPVNSSDIVVDGIEMVSSACQTVRFDSFNIRVLGEAMSSVNEIDDDLRIYTDGHNIIIESPVSQRVIISDVAGHSYGVDVAEGRTVIPARASGVMIVTAGNKTAKLMVK